MKKKVLSHLISREMQRKMIGACVLSFTIPMAMAADSIIEEPSEVEGEEDEEEDAE